MSTNVQSASTNALLVVEPRDEVRRGLRSLLRVDHRVFAVEHACSAFRVLRSGRFDGVIVSSCGGRDEARAIRAWLARHGMPIPVLGLVGLRDESESAAAQRPARPNQADGILSCLVVWPAVDRAAWPSAEQRPSHRSELEALM